jgi:hypothetical protein
MVIYYQSNDLVLEYYEGTYFFYVTNAPIVRKYTALSASIEFLKYKQRGKIPILLIRDLIDFMNQIIVLGIILFAYIAFLVIVQGDTIFQVLAVLVICAIYAFTNYVMNIANKLRR